MSARRWKRSADPDLWLWLEDGNRVLAHVTRENQGYGGIWYKAAHFGDRGVTVWRTLKAAKEEVMRTEPRGLGPTNGPQGPSKGE